MGACTGKSQKQQKAFDHKKTTQQFLNDHAHSNQVMLDVLLFKNGRITKEYTLLNPPIGKGQTGEVRKAIHRKSGMMRSVKIIQRQLNNNQENKKLLNEVELLEELDHPNILKIQEYYQDDRFFYIVTDLCTGGELFHKIEKMRILAEDKAANVMKQLFKALHYVHSNQVVHRDVRPENILFENERDDAQIRLIDFGQSQKLSPFNKLTGILGQAYYIAPEIQLGKKYDEKIDIWACGIVLYILLCGYPPFSGKSDVQISKKVIKGTYEFDEDDWQNISEEAKQLIQKCLNMDPTKRISAQQGIYDEWISKNTKDVEIEEGQLKRVFQNMITYETPIKLQEATMKMIVSFLASKEEKQELMQIFQYLDTDNDGKLSNEELINGMKKVMEPEEATLEGNRIITQFDRRKTFGLDYSNRQNLLTKNRMETAFKMIDRNGSGGIAIDELKETFAINKNQDDAWQQIITEVDRNQDGLISLSEFKEMLLKLTK